jgi:hypothetical protein
VAIDSILLEVASEDGGGQPEAFLFGTFEKIMPNPWEKGLRPTVDVLRLFSREGMSRCEGNLFQTVAPKCSGKLLGLSAAQWGDGNVVDRLCAKIFRKPTDSDVVSPSFSITIGGPILATRT